ncbi:peripheral Golgi membrane protein [Perkinsela sp. CCAP 1560/4]|nr:peripheral Golgi membrane protein [Perkinsela sp. CCAP 1560/4]|eukprot:KNH06234.1 peripheral Golgi membrane protein [Perkinsela sp. CCAP 1560/4]
MKPRKLSTARSAAARPDPRSLVGKGAQPNSADTLSTETSGLPAQRNPLKTPSDQSGHASPTGKPPNAEMEVTVMRAEVNNGSPERKTFVVSEVYAQLEDLRGVLNHSNRDEIREALMGDPFLAGAFYTVLNDLNVCAQ